MNTIAYCCASFGYRMSRLARTSPILCPPTTAENLDLSLLQGRDFVWVKLHGRRGERYWYGDNQATALSADQLARADLAGAVVFVSNCWLTEEDGTPSPMLIALAQAQPRAIIGGSGRNWAGITQAAASDILGLYVRFFLGFGFVPWNALRFAKARLRFKRQDLYTRDTLAFTLWTPLQFIPADHRAEVHPA